MNDKLKMLLMPCIALVLSGWYGLALAFANLYWMEKAVQYFPDIEYTFEYQLKILAMGAISFFGISLYSQITRKSFLPILKHLLIILILNIMVIIWQTPVPQDNFIKYAFETLKVKN